MILQIINVLLLGLILWRGKPHLRPLKIIYFSAALFRIACGFLIGWFYLAYLQNGDTLVFHRAATELHHTAKNAFGDYLSFLFTAHYSPDYGEARTEFMVKLLSIIYLLVDGNYWLASVYLSLLMFFSAWYLIRKLYTRNPDWLIPATVAFLFFPSSTLWSSGILKDTIANAAVFYLAAICLDYVHKNSLQKRQMVLTAICLLTLFHLKFYLAAVAGLIMGLLAWNIVLDQFTRHFYTRLALQVIGVTMLGLALSQINFNLQFENLPQAIFQNYRIILLKSQPGEALTFPDLQPTYRSLITHLPESLASGLFRPFVWEVKPVLLPFALENLLIFSLFLLNLRYYQAFDMSRLTALCLLFIFLLATVLPMVAPNFGTLMRYRSAFLPFFIFIIIVIPYQRLLLKK